MNPVFFATKRKIADLQKKLQKMLGGVLILNFIRENNSFDEDDKKWVINSSISAGVSGLYTGMEDIVRGLLSAIDGYVPSGESSHKDILDQASVAVDGQRPAILSSNVYDALIDLKGFRHFERHNYRFRYNETQVNENEVRAETVVPEFINDISNFISMMSNEVDEYYTKHPKI